VTLREVASRIARVSLQSGDLALLLRLLRETEPEVLDDESRGALESSSLARRAWLRDGAHVARRHGRRDARIALRGPVAS
jgi:hypothetical protein